MEEELNQKEVLALLKKKGIEKVTVKFSGGHDSGGTDGIEFEVLGETVQWTEKEVDTIRVGLFDALEAPVWDRYGSFAGEFNVYGEVVWDVKEEKVHIRGSEEVCNTEEFEEEIN
jgi:hypothetical protein